MRPLRYVVLAINALMIVSCIVVGAHYLVDLLAGAAVGVLAILISKGLVGGRVRCGPSNEWPGAGTSDAPPFDQHKRVRALSAADQVFS